MVRALEVDWQTLPAGAQPLRFSEAIANPVFAFVSLNGNGYGFDRDFDILSITGSDGAACGHWGSGCVTRRIVDLGGGVLQHHQLNSTGGESHGAIRFMGSFDTVTWNSLSNENWNGVTVGVQGTSIEVFGLPEPTGLALTGLAPDARSRCVPPSLSGQPAPQTNGGRRPAVLPSAYTLILKGLKSVSRS